VSSYAVQISLPANGKRAGGEAQRRALRRARDGEELAGSYVSG
jgi:hypothetical protein